MVTRPLNSRDYKVGWICTLSIELAAAIGMLDQRHPGFPKMPNDDNIYNLGPIGKHNIVLACLPIGKVGTAHTATAAIQMALAFPSIKFGIMTGIAGGIPPKVRLDDIVVGMPSDEYPAKDDRFTRTGSPKPTSNPLAPTLSKLRLERNLIGARTLEYVDAMVSRHPLYARPGSDEDVLFRQDYEHVDNDADAVPGSCDADMNEEEEGEEEKGCRLCDRSRTVRVRPRGMRVHYGLIASSNKVIKNATFRAKICQELGNKVLCIEMGAFGLVDKFPWLVVRGICDYADSHKNDVWNKHAAALAAAYAKEFLEHI
ncbi:nucleoside phosphorylase domain-containing protein [Nemania sp. FL0031]|nr:nucleoside phosphorylase domain-containing protein [Nemania sp. FL0031]